MFDSASGDVECQSEQQHGDDEVVGHDAGYHDVAEGEEQQGENRGCCLVQFQYFAKDSLQEKGGIEPAEHLDDYCDEKGTVVACEFHQSHIDDWETEPGELSTSSVAIVWIESITISCGATSWVWLKIFSNCVSQRTVI